MEWAGPAAAVGELPSCSLCEAHDLSERYHDDAVCWVADCVTCRVPLVVQRWHRPAPLAPCIERRMAGRLAEVATRLFGAHQFRIDAATRSIPDHYHLHARPARAGGMNEDPDSRRADAAGYPVDWLVETPLQPGRALTICDVDGVLSRTPAFRRAMQRSYQDLGPEERSLFFRSFDFDVPDASLVRWLNARDGDVMIVTSRPAALELATVRWLKRHSVRFNVLILRHDRYPGDEAEFKTAVCGEIDRLRLVPELAVDDSEAAARVYRRAGVRTVWPGPPAAPAATSTRAKNDTEGESSWVPPAWPASISSTLPAP